MNDVKIGEFAYKTNVPTKTIRYYEKIGLLPPPERSANGYRDYTDEAISLLRFVRDAQATGLTLTEISLILDLRSHGVGTCHHVVDLLERHLAGLERHIETLQKTREQLLVLTERARGLDPADCTDPNRCQTIEAGVALGTRPALRAEHVHIAPRSHKDHTRA